MSSPPRLGSSPQPGRRRKARSKPKKRYPSDLTDAQWALIAPLLPPPSGGGRPEKHPRREIVNAILYLDRAGCAWRLLPKCFPPWETVYWHWARWKAEGTVDRVHDALRDRLRDAEGRDPMASGGIIDSQSLRGADTVGAATRGYDAGKRTNGRYLEPIEMIMTLTSGDSMRTVSPTQLSARSDDRCGFLPRRVASRIEDVGRPALPEGQSERFAELLVLCLQVPDVLGRGLQPSQQRGIGGALPVGNRPPLAGWALPGSEAFDLGS
jgi:transposase